MDGESYLTKVASSLLILIIFWGLFFHFHFKYNDNNNLESIIGTFEFTTLFAIFLLLIIFLSKLLGNLIFGAIAAFIILLFITCKLDSIPAIHNMSFEASSYILLIIGVIIHIAYIVRAITSFRNYNLIRKYGNDINNIH